MNKDLTVNVKTRDKILLVDDDQRILNFIRIKLLTSGYDVITAVTGQGALSMIESQEPDLVVLDMKMPGMGGMEVLERLRAYSDIPVIAISALDISEEVLKTGANEFIAKPFKPDDLLRQIQITLEKTRK